MRLRRIDRYLLLLAVLFVVAILQRGGLPGEEVVPDLYRAAVHRPLLAQAAAAANRTELDRVRLKSELATARYEIRQLKEQLKRANQLADYLHGLKWEATPEAIHGWVFAVDPNLFRRAFSIDLGGADGIEAGMPVVTGRALLGLVMRTHLRESMVQRVDDPQLRLEVEIHTAAGILPGVAYGDGDRGLDVRLVRRAEALAKGDPVYTTRYHKAIPPGLVVGWVDEVKDLDRDLIPEIKVTPAAALGRWAQITVLKRRR